MDPPAYSNPPQPAYPGYPPPNQPYQAQGYPPLQPLQQAPVVQVTVPAQTITTQVVSVGNCPVCHVGTLRDQFSVLGLVLAIFFFPLGIICCLMMTERVCGHCGAHLGG